MFGHECQLAKKKKKGFCLVTLSVRPEKVKFYLKKPFWGREIQESAEIKERATQKKNTLPYVKRLKKGPQSGFIPPELSNKKDQMSPSESE